MAETRKAFVQQLRWLVRECGVPLVRDDASRERVVAFTEAILASGATAELKDKVRTLLRKYQATWPSEATALPLQSDSPRPVDKGEYRLRGTSFLLTYNWDFLHLPFPGLIV